MTPSAEQQVQFLLRLQRLLREGLFTATYKYALLMALADLSIELGDDSGDPLDVTAEKIGEKFIEFYWRQTIPFLGIETLRQNTGRPPVVITLLLDARAKYGDSLSSARRDHAAWHQLVRNVTLNVRAMPLRFLQNVGGECMPFLYSQPVRVAPKVIRLNPGMAFCFRRFHGLISELIQAAWAKWVRQQNLPVIGETADLHEFLFGSTRAPLILLQGPLRDLQQGLCFYCQRQMSKQVEVDHFVPWTLYPLDLGHNFVLAHRECNSAKRDLLASEKHLDTWVNRNRVFGAQLAKEFDAVGVLHNQPCTTRIAHWAYSAASTASGLTWTARDNLVPLTGHWLQLLA